MTGPVETAHADGVLTLLLDRPDKKNAITDAMYAAMADSLEAARDDPAVRVVLIRGAGDTFTAGNDIADFAAVAAGGRAPVHVGRFIAALADATKPLVAAVQGRAVGIGTTLLLHCDHVVLADDALLSTPFVGLALVPEAGSSVLLPHRIGHARAFAMFALGEAIDAARALDWGLANAVVPAADLVPHAERVARRLAAQPPGALIATKALMRPAGALSAQIARETDAFVARLRTAEAAEAFAAFAQRRAPDFATIAAD